MKKHQTISKITIEYKNDPMAKKMFMDLIIEFLLNEPIDRGDDGIEPGDS